MANDHAANQGSMGQNKITEMRGIGGILCVALNWQLVDSKSEAMLWTETTSTNLKDTLSIFVIQVFVMAVEFCIISNYLFIPFSPYYLLFTMSLQMLRQKSTGCLYSHFLSPI
jgi:hypothetical protein